MSSSTPPKSIKPVLSVVLPATLLLVYLGWFAAYRSMEDADMCWILALGRWIFSHHGLPLQDPWSNYVDSYAAVGAGQPLMQYQWLSMLITYGAYCAGNTDGIRMLTAFLATSAFILVPLQILSRSRVSPAATIVLVTLTALSAKFRWLARPEMFSYFFFAVLIAAIVEATRPDLTRTKRLLLVAIAALAMAAWSNLHILFVVGLVTAGVSAAAGILAWLIARDKSNADRAWNLVAIMVAAAAATFCNPWGVGLWVYFQRVQDSPINKFIIENLPITYALQIQFLPFAVLTVLSLVAVGNAVRSNWKSAGNLVAASLEAAALLLTCSHFKLMPFGAIAMLAAIACSASTSAPTIIERILPNLHLAYQQANQVMAKWQPLNSPLVAASVILVTMLSAWATSHFMLSPEIPPTTPLVRCPQGGLAFVSEHRPAGNLFNWAEYGNAMIWHLEKTPRLFMDTRYSMHEPQVVLDYRDMLWCQPGWQKLLAKYQIGWVFLPPEAPLAKALLTDRDRWQPDYVGKDSVILTRTLP